MDCDAVVVGSGAGGLTAAVALARAGRRVLVLERHPLPGGWTHSFSLDGSRFGPGLHTLGSLQEGGLLRRVYEGLGVADDLEFAELNPDGFNHLLIEGMQFDQPRGLDAWIDRLGEAFPSERDGITRSFEALARVVAELDGAGPQLRFAEVMTMAWRAPQLLRWCFSTLQGLLAGTVTDPVLRAVLSAQCGNHGLAPSRVPLPIHAAMSADSFEGAFFPRGGPRRIPRALLRELQRRGGELRVGARVKQLLVERGRVAGVELADGERITAHHVVCDEDPARLLPGARGARWLPRGRRARGAPGGVSVLCAVELDLRARGFDSGNYWWYRTADVDAHVRPRESPGPDAEPDALFLSIPTLKDPGSGPPGVHTLELFCFLPWDPFLPWAGLPRAQRGPAFDELERSLGDAVLRAAENVIPDLRSHVRFVEVSTPLAKDGASEAPCSVNPGAVMAPWLSSPKGPVDGLHASGASPLVHGVTGATLAGLRAAAEVLRVDRLDALLAPQGAPLRVVSAEQLGRRREPRLRLVPQMAAANEAT